MSKTDPSGRRKSSTPNIPPPYEPRVAIRGRLGEREEGCYWAWQSPSPEVQGTYSTSPEVQGTYSTSPEVKGSKPCHVQRGRRRPPRRLLRPRRAPPSSRRTISNGLARRGLRRVGKIADRSVRRSAALEPLRNRGSGARPGPCSRSGRGRIDLSSTTRPGPGPGDGIDRLLGGLIERRVESMLQPQAEAASSGEKSLLSSGNAAAAFRARRSSVQPFESMAEALFPSSSTLLGFRP